MAYSKDKNTRTGNKPCSAESFGRLSESPFGCAVDLDSVDWGAVARSYKILRLRAVNPETFGGNRKLAEDYDRWIALRSNSIEFDIALRMHFDEAEAAQRFLMKF